MRSRVIALLLLAACSGGGESPTAPPPPMPTIAALSVSGQGCESYTQYPIRGTLTAVVGGFRTNELSIWVGQSAIEVMLPAGGAYRSYFYYGPSLFEQQLIWDFSTNILPAQRNVINMGCTLAKPQ